MKQSFTFFILIAVLPIVAGCASMQQDLGRQGQVTIVEEPSDGVSFSFSKVVQEATTVTVSSHLQFNDASDYWNMASHVDVTIQDNQLNPLFVAYAPYRKASAHGSSTRAKFSVSAKLVVPDNATLVIRHHVGPMLLHQQDGENF